MKKDYCSCVPDEWFGIDISPACKIHDEHYAGGGVTRKEADIQFRNNIIAIGRENNKTARLTVIAWIYYFGVRIFGAMYSWD